MRCSVKSQNFKIPNVKCQNILKMRISKCQCQYQNSPILMSEFKAKVKCQTFKRTNVKCQNFKMQDAKYPYLIYVKIGCSGFLVATVCVYIIV